MRRLAAAASAVAALLCVSAIPAQAAQAEHVPPLAQGKVNARQGGVVRSGPGTKYAISGHLRNNQVVSLICKASGEAVRGNTLWYKVNERPEMWASASFIAGAGQSPAWCAHSMRITHPRHHRTAHRVTGTRMRHHRRLRLHHIARHPHHRLMSHGQSQSHGQIPAIGQNSQGAQGTQGAQNPQNAQNPSVGQLPQNPQAAQNTHAHTQGRS